MVVVNSQRVFIFLLFGALCMGMGYIHYIGLSNAESIRTVEVLSSNFNSDSDRANEARVEATFLSAVPVRTICNVYNSSAPTKDHHDCLLTTWNPAFYICVHPIWNDIWVSLYIRFTGIWEKENLGIFQNLLKLDPEYGVIDIGANIGVYALMAARMGRDVIAVEARLLHVEMIHHALHKNKLHNSPFFTLLHNAISDNHNTLRLTLESGHNQGHTRVVEGGQGSNIPNNEVQEVPAIYLDDLLEVVHFRKAIMKMDIEGSEHRAIAHCEKLLKQVYIPFIFMEWLYLRDMEQEQILIRDILTRNGYSAFTLDQVGLQIAAIKTWPQDIIWKHSNASFT
eukprot:GHVN01080114.1.p1 GENE.GHVN01080114.1~~GHVN01080114.1.p1  ORF type:complete len:339 (+),score=5.61 GHVN01080114.1:66-1082(+)